MKTKETILLIVVVGVMAAFYIWSTNNDKDAKTGL